MTKHMIIATAYASMGANYLKSAVLLAERAKRVEQSLSKSAFELRILHNSLVTSSLLASVCSLEATINEWFSFSEMGATSKSVRKRIEQFWLLGIPRTASFQILQKYQVGLALSGKPTLDEGTEPFQSARCLVELRNWLVHYEPTWESVPEYEALGLHKEHKLAKRLRGRFPLNPLSSPTASFWPYKCLGSGCALWAVESALVFMDAFFDSCDPKSTSRVNKAYLDKARQLGQSADWSEYGF